MILDVATIVSFFLAGVGGALAAAALGVATTACWTRRRARGHDGDQAVDGGAHLLALLLGVLGLIRLIAWPHFYWLMGSYVEPLAPYGVMCVFGVTRIQADVVLAVQIVKPLALVSVGLWWALTRADFRSGTRALVRPRLVLAVPVAGLLLLECTLEIDYLLREKVGQRITCCTQFLRTDAAALPSDAASWFRRAEVSSETVMGIYVGVSLLVIAGCAYLCKHGLPSNRLAGASLATAAALAGGVHLLVAHWAWLEALAPRVLQLPYHHCVYELLTDTPALGIAAAMTVAGGGGLCLPAVLELWRRRAPEPVAAVQRELYELCAVAVASALLIVGVHGF